MYHVLMCFLQKIFFKNEPSSISRESLVLLDLLVLLDTRDLVACPVSVELLDPLEARERR